LTNPKRGEVWLVDFDPTRPDEIGKTRPALVIQSDEIDIGTTLVIPFSTVIVPDSEPLRVHYKKLSFLDKSSDLAITQMRALSVNRFHKKIGSLPASDMSKVSQYIGMILCLK
jgi:mRNA interferase MazF